MSVVIAESVISPLAKIFSAVVVTPISPIIMASTSFLYGAGSVAGDTLQQKEFSDEQRATMSSLVSFGGNICVALSSLLLGIIADNWGVVVALVFAQLVLLATNGFYVKVLRLSK